MNYGNRGDVRWYDPLTPHSLGTNFQKHSTAKALLPLSARENKDNIPARMAALI